VKTFLFLSLILFGFQQLNSRRPFLILFGFWRPFSFSP
jgi:hypothetical protein